MKKIYLFCSAGMSSSMLAQNMQKAADEHNLAVKVEAFSSTKLSTIVENDQPDVILLGPQAKFMYDDVNGRYGDRIPVGVMNSEDYGTLNGERTLKFAISLLKRKKTA